MHESKNNFEAVSASYPNLHRRLTELMLSKQWLHEQLVFATGEKCRNLWNQVAELESLQNCFQALFKLQTTYDTAESARNESDDTNWQTELASELQVLGKQLADLTTKLSELERDPSLVTKRKAIVEFRAAGSDKSGHELMAQLLESCRTLCKEMHWKAEQKTVHCASDIEFSNYAELRREVRCLEISGPEVFFHLRLQSAVYLDRRQNLLGTVFVYADEVNQADPKELKFSGKLHPFEAKECLLVHDLISGAKFCSLDSGSMHQLRCFLQKYVHLRHAASKSAFPCRTVNLETLTVVDERLPQYELPVQEIFSEDFNLRLYRTIHSLS